MLSEKKFIWVSATKSWEKSRKGKGQKTVGGGGWIPHPPGPYRVNVFVARNCLVLFLIESVAFMSYKIPEFYGLSLADLHQMD